MASIPVAPFYVPKPPDDSVWLWGPQASDIIPILTSQTFFHKGGQVPAKSWASAYSYFEASPWLSTPVDSPIIAFLTKQIMYGKGGQVPVKSWNSVYTSYEASVWYASPLDSPIIAYLTKQTMFGKGGQVPAKQWHYDNDDAAPFWSYKTRNIVIVSAQPSPFVPVFWRYNFDESALSWQRPVERSIALPFVPNIKPVYWPFNNDDHSVFWKPTTQRSIALPLTPQSPFIQRQQRFDYDVGETFWQGNPLLSKIIPMLTVGGQVQSYQWLFGYDDPAFWVGRPLNSAAPIPMLTVGGIIKAKQWHWDNDDPAMWSGWINRNLTNIATVQPNPFIPFFWRFNNDDPPPWQQPPQRSIALPFVPVIFNRRRFDIAEDQLWSLTIQTSFSLYGLNPKPFVNRWNIDPPYDPPWLRTISRSLAIAVLNLPFPFFNKTRFDLADDQLWWPSRRVNLANNVFTLVPAPFTIRQSSFAYDDYSYWQWLPKNNRFLPYSFIIDRVAYTMAENRVAIAPVQNRVANTSPETRTAIAPKDKK